MRERMDIVDGNWPCERLIWFDPLDFSEDGEDGIPLTITDGYLFWRPIVPLYSIIFERFTTWDEAYRAFRALSEKMSRMCRKRPDIACMLGLSCTEGRGAVKERAKSGKRGAAEFVVKGKEVAPHIHMVIMASNTATVCKEITSKYNRKRGFTAAKSKKMDSLAYVSYVYNQSNYITNHGCFDFSAYCIPYDENQFPKHNEYLKWLDEQDGDKKHKRYNAYMEKWKGAANGKNMDLNQADATHIGEYRVGKGEEQQECRGITSRNRRLKRSNPF